MFLYIPLPRVLSCTSSCPLQTLIISRSVEAKPNKPAQALQRNQKTFLLASSIRYLLCKNCFQWCLKQMAACPRAWEPQGCPHAAAAAFSSSRVGRGKQTKSQEPPAYILVWAPTWSHTSIPLVLVLSIPWRWWFRYWLRIVIALECGKKSILISRIRVAKMSEACKGIWGVCLLCFLFFLFFFCFVLFCSAQSARGITGVRLQAAQRGNPNGTAHPEANSVRSHCFCPEKQSLW